MSTNQKKTIYLVRHGQSIDNVSPVFQSDDSPLSDEGIVQAQSIAERLSKIEFESLISSPIVRAKQTAEFVADKSNKSIVYSDLFIERTMPSEISGKPWTDEAANKTWREWEKSLYTPGMRIGDGENYDDVVLRADKALDFLQNQAASTIAVVTHGYFLRVIVARALLGENLTSEIMRRFHQRAYVENTAISVIKYQDAFEEDFAWRLWTLNDHSHFAE